ncbi:MAG TPA: S41 family peptidase [Pseudomonadales bacterium]|nr:S41 family peptidase [Pseudomonadales bacterium]
MQTVPAQIESIFRLRAVLLALGFLTLGACGGGGSSGPAAVAPVAPAPAPAAPPPAGFDNGTFASSRFLEAMCASPRVGIDAETGRPWPDVQGTFVDENDWLRSWSNELYLWFDEIEDVDPASLATPAYFDRMRTFATTPTGAPKDRFHFTESTAVFRAFAQSGVAAGYGAELALLATSPPREIRVAYTLTGSPAELAALERGTEIVTVDGVDARLATSAAEIDVLNAALFPAAAGETHVFGVLDRGASVVREVSMTAVELTTPPVQAIARADTASGAVGYVAFFEHIATAENALIDVIENFRADPVTDLVVDLRYNGGGLLSIAAELGFMVAGPAAASGQVFEALEFNRKHQQFNPVTGAPLSPELFPSTTLGFLRPPGEPLPSLDLERVFVLTGPGTCSASESFMNSLRGIGIEVVQIGDRTCGKPYGFYPTDNCGTTYFSIQFRGVNAQGWGDYGDGFVPGADAGPAGVMPGCVIEDDFTADLGDPAEALFAAALSWRSDGACPATALATEAAGRRLVRPVDPALELRPPVYRTGTWKMP